MVLYISIMTSSLLRLLKWMISQGYSDPRTLARRVKKMEAWLASPSLMEADKEAEYAAVIDIKLDDLKEPILCCPNDPDDAKKLSEAGVVPFRARASEPFGPFLGSDRHQRHRRSLHRLLYDEHWPRSQQ